MKKIRWGIIGAGRIVHRFMKGLNMVSEAHVTALYARNAQRGRAVADQYGIERFYDDIDAFLDSGAFDVAYVSVPHAAHMDFSIKCLQKKIPVVCEKPLAVNAGQVRRMIDCARENDTFLMEAMWTRMFPVTRQVCQWLDEGRIGKVVGMQGSFCFRGPEDDTDRLYIPEAGGGSVLDVGIYLVAYANMVFKREPKEVMALGHVGRLGTDDNAGVVFLYDGGEVATLQMGFLSEGKHFVTIYGREGLIEIFPDFWRPRAARLTHGGGYIDFTAPVIEDTGAVYAQSVSFAGEGYQFQVAHVHELLSAGEKESPLIPLEDSLSAARTADRVRQMLGVRYPFE